MEKTKKNFNLNIGIMFLIVLLIIFIAMIAFVIIDTTKERKEVIVLPDYSSTKLEKELLLDSGKLFTVGKTDFVTGVSYNTTIKADTETNIVNYTVDATTLKIGDMVEKEQVIGEFEGVSVKAVVQGKVVDAYFNEQLNQTKVTLLNNESYFVEFFVPEKDRNKFSFETQLKVKFDDNQFNAQIDYIGYELSSQGIKIKANVSDDKFLLIKGLSVEVIRITSYVENALVISRSAISNVSNFASNSFNILNAPTLLANSSGGSGTNLPSTTPSIDYSTFTAQTVNVTVAELVENYYVLSTRVITISAVNDQYCLVTNGLSEGETIFVAT